MSGTLVTISPRGILSTYYWKARGRPSFEIIRELVGDYFEPVQLRWNGKIREAYVDENGIGKSLAANWRATQLLDGRFKEKVTVLCGPCVIWVPEPRVRKEK